MSPTAWLGAVVPAVVASFLALPAAPAEGMPVVRVFVTVNVPESDVGWISVVLDAPAGRDVTCGSTPAPGRRSPRPTTAPCIAG